MQDIRLAGGASPVQLNELAGSVGPVMMVKNYTMQDALIDPKRVFGTPERLLSEPRLERSTKLRILKRWRQDEEALLRAQYEGMEGDGNTLLRRVDEAIDRLSDD